VSRPFTLLESADLTGRARYVELALFAALGAQVTRAEDPAVAVYLAGAARAHGFRARLLEELLPVSLGLPGVEESTRSPHPALDGAVAALIADGPDRALVATLVGLVYPLMLAAYDARREAAAPAADAPLLRTFRRLRDDLEATRHEGIGLADEVADARAEEVGRLLKEAGGPFGVLRAAF
jgi:hypothetical protein